jgi:hypothetical protein
MSTTLTVSSPSHAITATARTLGCAVLAGGIAAFLAGGVAARLAMRLLALTSPDIAQGRLTDDAARVGQFTITGSLSLAAALSMAGAFLGPVYLLVRRVLPDSRAKRIAGYALLTGTVGGALLVHDHPSFDYTILQPAWLAVTVFVLVPASYGALTALVVERMAPRRDPLVGGRLATWWGSAPVSIAGSVLYWALVAWGTYGIITDVASLMRDHANGAPFTI